MQVTGWHWNVRIIRKDDVPAKLPALPAQIENMDNARLTLIPFETGIPISNWWGLMLLNCFGSVRFEMRCSLCTDQDRSMICDFIVQNPISDKRFLINLLSCGWKSHNKPSMRSNEESMYAARSLFARIFSTINLPFADPLVSAGKISGCLT